MLVATLLACAAAPTFAMTQCPVESVKPGWFVALGYGVLALAACLGFAAPVFTWRRTRDVRPSKRALWLLGACVVMLGVWLAGLMIWLGAFVLPC
ncbi:hypothetical protein [Luteimonas fraxinea]|uniref:hypothetical protein n=1 Tax=Luteimonas fraxinea TaxID=2901869 RepID=UPI001E404C7D|nr:hypothetical protein [Luteimonas fraxinea]